MGSFAAQGAGRRRCAARVLDAFQVGRINPLPEALQKSLRAMYFSIRMNNEEMVKAIEVEAEPFNCLMNLNRAVYLNAQKRGISALLDGIDWDVLLSGSGHLTPLWGRALTGRSSERH